MAKKKAEVAENKPVRSLGIEGKKTLFCTLWALHGHNAFPRQLREEYIEQLWDANPSSKKDLRKSELLSATDVNEVIKKYSPMIKICQLLRNSLPVLISCHRKLSAC
jgi:hypothetical protein